jgi:hypothetical protein
VRGFAQRALEGSEWLLAGVSALESLGSEVQASSSFA